MDRQIKKILYGKKIIVSSLSGIALTLTGCLNLNSDSKSVNSETDFNNVTVTTYKNSNNYSNSKQSTGYVPEKSKIDNKKSNNNVNSNDTNDTIKKNDNINESKVDLNNIYVSFKDIEIDSSLNEIKQNNITFYFKDIIKPEKSLEKYMAMKEYDSTHSLKYLKNGQVDISLLKTKIISNTNQYFSGEHKAYYKECTNSEFDTIFNNLVLAINSNIKNDIDILELDDVLDDLKIVSLTGTSNGAFVSYENILGINFDLLNKIGMTNSIDAICLHESNHVIQSGSEKEKKHEGYEKNLGVLYQWNDLDVNALNYQWFIEGSAEKLIDKNMQNDDVTYKYMVNTLDSMYLSSIFNNKVDEYTLSYISLQPDLNKLFNYFNCNDESDKIETIMMFYTYDIINNSNNTEFKDAYKEKYNMTFSLDYNDILECQCAEVLSKNFYYYLINGLHEKDESISNIFYVIKLFETDLNNKTKTTNLINDDQKIFITNYLNNREIFFKLLSKKTGLTIDEIHNLYNNYDLDSNNIENSNYFNINQKKFIYKMSDRVKIKNDYLLDNYKIK